MPTNPYSNYLEATILSADPIELVRVLYRTAIDSVRDARGYLAAHDVAGRSRSINKAVAALRELSFCLNHDANPALARTLAELYDFMQRQLLTAHFEQTDGPLAEVAGLLENVSEAWEKVEVEKTPDWAADYSNDGSGDRAELAAAEA